MPSITPINLNKPDEPEELGQEPERREPGELASTEGCSVRIACRPRVADG